jgi:hypothetical protein
VCIERISIRIRAPVALPGILAKYVLLVPTVVLGMARVSAYAIALLPPGVPTKATEPGEAVVCIDVIFAQNISGCGANA